MSPRPGIASLILALALACAAHAAHAQPARVLAPRGAYEWPGGPLAFGERETARCLECHGLPEFFVRDSATGAVRNRHVSAVGHAASAHASLACTQCHADVRAYPHAFPARRRTVGCDDDCHAADSTGRTVRHTDARAALAASVHARGLEGRDAWQPGCLACHGDGDPHAVARERGTSRSARARACLACHDEREPMRERAVHADAVASYRASLHFKAMRRGDGDAPGCPDCHGAHGVRVPADTASTVHPTKLARTCGQEGCHPGARLRFSASGANHVTLRLDREPRLAWAVGGLRAAGLLLLLGMTASVVLDVQRRWGTTRRPGSTRLVPRITAGLRLQHAGLAIAFTVLALTGLALRHPDAAWLDAVPSALGGIGGSRGAHRAAAMLLALVVAAHGVQALRDLARARFDPRRAWGMLPGPRDLAEAWQSTRYQLRRRAAPPAFGRRHWREKLHYLAVLAGAAVMLGTGLLMAWPVALAERLPAGALAFALLVHGHEALVAIGILLVWHLYQVHVAPRPDHRWLTALDGRVTEGHWRVEHALEAERALGPAPGAPARGAEAVAVGHASWTAIALGAVLVAALALRMREALRTPLWFDELFTLAVARLPAPDLFEVLARDIHPPLFTLLVRGWIHLGGEHALWLKALPMGIGIAAVAATYGFARRLFGPVPGLVAAALLAVHHEHVYFSQELRGYSLLALAVLLAAWAAWNWLESARRPAAVSWVLAATAAAYTHYLAVVVLGVMVAVVAFELRREPRRLLHWLGLQAAVAACFAPQLPVLLGQLRIAQDHWLRHPAWHDLLDFARHLAFGGRWAIPVVLAFAIAAFAPARTRRAVSFLALLIGLGVLVPFVATRLGAHLYVQRYMYFVLPLLAVWLAAGVCACPGRPLRALAFAGLALIGARAAWITPPHREAVALQAAARRVAELRRPGEPVFCADPHTLLCLQRHLGRDAVWLVTDGHPLPFYLGESIVPPSDRVPVADVRAADSAGVHWWAVHTRLSGPAPALGPALLDSLASRPPHAFDRVRVWEGRP